MDGFALLCRGRILLMLILMILLLLLRLPRSTAYRLPPASAFAPTSLSLELLESLEIRMVLEGIDGWMGGIMQGWKGIEREITCLCV